MITLNPPVPTAVGATAATPSSRLADESLPKPNHLPVGLDGPFLAPNLIVPVDKADPSKIIDNSYIAQLSATLSTVFVFDVLPEHQGQTCNLAFHMPPAFSWPDLSPVKMQMPGGILVSSVEQQSAAENTSTSNVVSSGLVGWIPLVQPGNQYNLVSTPCAAGQRVAYQIESTGGLAMDFFQMTRPPLGLFMSVS